MDFKKNVLTAAVVALLLSGGANADENGWGAVAGGSEPSTAGTASTTTAGGWGEPAAEAAAPEKPQAVAGKPACGADDPRYASLVPVLKSLQAGETIEPMQTSFSTYVNLNGNVRSILADNIYISSPDCSEQHLFNGELTGKVNVPFAGLWQVINDAMRTDDLALMQFVAKNTRAAPESAQGIISMVQYVHLNDNEVRKLYSAIAPDKAKQTDIQKPLMLEIFLTFGGTVIQAERGKTAYIHNNGRNNVVRIFLERRGGSADPQGVNFENGAAYVNSLLQSAGLSAEVAGYGAEKLASE
jgi:hypothetical protein